MKRLFAFLLALVLMVSASALAVGNPVLLNKDGIKIVAKDAYFKKTSLTNEYELVFDVEVTNSTNKDYMVTSINSFINGYDLDAHAYISIGAESKRKDNFYIKLNDIDMTKAADLKKITEVKVKLAYFPSDDVLNSKRSTKKINAAWVRQKVKQHK